MSVPCWSWMSPLGCWTDKTKFPIWLLLFLWYRFLKLYSAAFCSLIALPQNRYKVQQQSYFIIYVILARLHANTNPTFTMRAFSQGAASLLFVLQPINWILGIIVSLGVYSRFVTQEETFRKIQLILLNSVIPLIFFCFPWYLPRSTTWRFALVHLHQRTRPRYLLPEKRLKQWIEKKKNFFVLKITHHLVIFWQSKCHVLGSPSSHQLEDVLFPAYVYCRQCLAVSLVNAILWTAQALFTRATSVVDGIVVLSLLWTKNKRTINSKGFFFFSVLHAWRR